MPAADDTMSVGGRTARTSATAIMTDRIRNTPADELACDSKYVQKLFRKIQRALTTRGAYGKVEISEAFKRLDRSLTREAVEWRERAQIAQQYGTHGNNSNHNSSKGFGDGLSRGHGVATNGYKDPYAHHYAQYLVMEGRGGDINQLGGSSSSSSSMSSNPFERVDVNNFLRYIHDGLSMEGVTLKELEVLFVLLDTDGDGLVDMADALLSIRKLFHCTAQQFHEILAKVRSRRPQLYVNRGSDPNAADADAQFSLHQQQQRRNKAVGGGGNGVSGGSNGSSSRICSNPFRKRSGAMPSRPPTREMLYDYLLRGGGVGGPFGLTESEVFLFLDYCSIQEKDVGGGGGNGFGGGPRAESQDLDDGMPCAPNNRFGGMGIGRGASQSPDNNHSSSGAAAHANGGGRFLGELDLAYMEAVLYSETLPDDVAFPLVMAKFVEAATDPSKGDKTGTAGMLRALRQCSLVPSPSWVASRRGGGGGGANTNNATPSRRVGGGAGHPSDQSFTFGDSPEARRDKGGITPQHHNGGAGGGGAFPLHKTGVFEASFNANNANNGNGGFAADDYEEDSAGADSHKRRARPPITAMCLDGDNFRRFLHIFQGGLPVGECDLLFGYICDPQSGLLSVETLINLFQERIDVWAAVDMSLTLGVVRSHVNLLQLHILLASQFGCYAEIPLENVILSLRRCGVPTMAVSDIEVEHVYRETRTAAALVLLIRGPIPQPREHTMGKLFDRLDEDDDGNIPCDLLLRAYDPSQPPNTKAAMALQADMYAYLMTIATSGEGTFGGSGSGGGDHHLNADGRYGSMGGTSNNSNNTNTGGGGFGIDASCLLSYSEFTYFWGCISLRFDTDADFTLFVWKAYRMHEGKRRGYATVIPDRRAPIPLARLVAIGGGGGGIASTSSGGIGAGYNDANSFYAGNATAGGVGTASVARMRGVSPSVGGGGGGGLYFSGMHTPGGGSRSVSRGVSVMGGVRGGGGGGFSRNVSSQMGAYEPSIRRR